MKHFREGLHKEAGDLLRGLRWCAVGGVCAGRLLSAQGNIGADVPWTTIEAESMRTTGAVLGPEYGPHRLETEASGQKCVKLARAGEYLEFEAPAEFDSLVLRYSLPDSEMGGGTTLTLSLLVNGRSAQNLRLSSRDVWLYGTYPFSNDPKQGKPRHFYDELRVKNVKIGKGDVVRLQKSTDDGVDCVVDLVDLELVPTPVAKPAGSVSVLDCGATANGNSDDTDSLRKCIAAAQEHGGIVWVPAGYYKLTGDIIVPSGISIQGAGMWHTTFVGDETLYGQADRRVRFILSGANVRLADFAIIGRLNYRNDQEANDGVVVAECTNASVARVWIEHTKTGVWVYNGTHVVVESCRFRNLLADGVNFCVGTNHSIVQNCAARGTGDDCFAVWPAPADQKHVEQTRKPGSNVIRRSTGQLPFLANGGALYGGADNRIEDCLFTDITAGCGILISTTFPTADERRNVDNNFSGETVVRNCRLIRCGGYDHSWAWRGALEICMDRRSISGLRIRQLEIRDSLSDGITVVATGRANGEGTLSDTELEDVVVSRVGLGVPPGRSLWVHGDAAGGLTLIHSEVDGVHNESADFTVSTPTK